MTRDTLFLAFGNVKSDYLHAAAASMEAPVSTLPRPRLRFALIAASFLLIAAMIPILVILAKHTTPPPLPPTPATSDSETSSTPSTEAPTTHLSITDIPGAIAVDTDTLDYQIDTTYSFNIIEGIRKVQESCAFLGTLISCESVFIPSDNNKWYLHLSVLEIQINDPVCNADTLQTVKAVYKCIYFPKETGYRISRLEPLMDLAIKAQKEPYGFYVLDEAENYFESLGTGSRLNMADYADYYIVMHASYDGKMVSYPRLFNIDLEYFRSGIPGIDPWDDENTQEQE